MAPGRGVAGGMRAREDVHASDTPPMSNTHPPAPRPPEGSDGLTREQKMQLLHDELIKLNAQLEYLRLMLRLRAPKA
jgi:hypothetical protein